jgi:D-glycerate 3-kinase
LQYICQVIPNSIAISIDDFYFTREQQLKLAAKYVSNPYLQKRGHPGTHDIKFGTKVLQSLKAGLPTQIPSYDKSLHQGNGDRITNASWRVIDKSVRLVILEGWMLGFVPLKNVSDPHLRQTNVLLSEYLDWTQLLDAFVCLRTDNLENIVAWRIQAEQKMRANGKAGLSDTAIEAYIRLFLPAYRLYTPQLAELPNALHIDLKLDRTVHLQPSNPFSKKF